MTLRILLCVRAYLLVRVIAVPRLGEDQSLRNLVEGENRPLDICIDGTFKLDRVRIHHEDWLRVGGRNCSCQV